MKKLILFAASVALLASCANDTIIDNGGKTEKNVPITLSTSRQNITRATSSLESNLHYNFGAWAQKIKGSDTQKVMENYLVGYTDQVNTGYYLNGATTWGGGSTQTQHDHLSPWFYENLGKAQYLYDDATSGLYTKSNTAYMSANDYQYLRYWDLAYINTNFYCYSPYQASGVTLVMNDDGAGTATMTLANNIVRDGYDNPVNSAYKKTADHAAYDRSLAEFMVGGTQATNSAHADVTIPFQHIGSQLFIRFYEDVPGYKVEILDLNADGGTFTTDATTDQKTGIQATPAVLGTSEYTLGKYYVKGGATVKFSTTAVPTITPAYTDNTTNNISDNLMFHAPSITPADYSTANVPVGFTSVENKNWTKVEGTQSATTTHYVIPELAASATDQNYAWSPTIYYPVAQPSTSTTGFTFHVTYRIIADDNKEVTTVHNATVFVPATGNAKVDGTDKTDVTIARWEANTRYIYTFKITKNATGSTSPTGPIDPVSPTPSTTKSLYPIVFDQCTIEDYIVNDSEHTISDGTSY